MGVNEDISRGREGATPTCFEQEGGLRVGVEAPACDGRSGSAAG